MSILSSENSAFVGPSVTCANKTANPVFIYDFINFFHVSALYAYEKEISVAVPALASYYSHAESTVSELFNQFVFAIIYNYSKDQLAYRHFFLYHYAGIIANRKPYGVSTYEPYVVKILHYRSQYCYEQKRFKKCYQ